MIATLFRAVSRMGNFLQIVRGLISHRSTSAPIFHGTRLQTKADIDRCVRSSDSLPRLSSDWTILPPRKCYTAFVYAKQQLKINCPAIDCTLSRYSAYKASFWWLLSPFRRANEEICHRASITRVTYYYVLYVNYFSSFNFNMFVIVFGLEWIRNSTYKVLDNNSS